MPLSREEQETVIRHGWGESEMTMTTTNPAHARHMQRLGVEPYATTAMDGEVVSWIFKVDATYFKLPRPKKRVGEAQRQALSQRMRKKTG